MMKTIIFLIIFGLSGSVFGQYSRPVTPTPTPKVYDTADDLIKLKPTPMEKLQLAIEANNEANKWKLVATSADDERPTMWFYQRSRRIRNDVEVWLKAVYTKPILHKSAPIIYSMDFHVFHCGQGRRTIETSMGYDAKGNVVMQIKPGDYGMNQREPVGPESVNEILYEYFCS